MRQVPTHTGLNDVVIFHITPQNNVSRENWQAACTIVVTHRIILTAFRQQQESSNNSIIGLNDVALYTYVDLTSVLIAVVSDVFLKLVLSSRSTKIAGDFHLTQQTD